MNAHFCHFRRLKRFEEIPALTALIPTEREVVKRIESVILFAGRPPVRQSQNLRLNKSLFFAPAKEVARTCAVSYSHLDA